MPVPKKNQSGQSIIEVLMAMAVAIIILGGLVSAVVASVRNTQFAKNQSLATKYAEEGMEKLRAFRDQNTWSIFTGGCNCGVNCTALGISVPSPFSVSVACTVVDSSKNQTVVTVSWIDGAGTHQSRLTSLFTMSTLWR